MAKFYVIYKFLNICEICVDIGHLDFIP